jgi:hypothetical protein
MGSEAFEGFRPTFSAHARWCERGAPVQDRKGCAVHSVNAADCSTCVAVRFRDIVAFGDSIRARRTAAVIAHLLPRSWGSFLRHGWYGFL